MTTSTKFNVLLLAFLTPALAAAAAVKPVVSTIEDHVAVPIQLSDHVPINYKCEFSIGGANGATLPVSNGNLGHAVGPSSSVLGGVPSVVLFKRRPEAFRGQTQRLDICGIVKVVLDLKQKTKWQFQQHGLSWLLREGGL
ncbi:hypothetical protein HDK90DRAFT_507579 [Phyllosticta capitalensis]|uniref:Uncharacterized protein n=1 Tax=Phyllosticta capitalensis TaxID=121624 RepID=A0ABR1YZM3_9PEZI